jgi:hypothetical protein
MVLGEQLVQGVDYAYTIQGWLKGMNSTSNYNGLYDMAHDGEVGGQNQYIARDVVGFNLTYFVNDYLTINGYNPFLSVPGDDANGTPMRKNLFNGNISSMAVNIKKFDYPLLYSYKYDQLNRLRAVDAYDSLFENTNQWNPHPYRSFRERITYDPNGNIQTANRYWKYDDTRLDSLVYHYTAGTNKLDHIDDREGSSLYGQAHDLQDQVSGNYGYDAIGNLIKIA